MRITNSKATYLIVGGGSAGCVLASRLSEDSRSRVVLIEAGPDHLPDSNPADILATYPGKAMSNIAYFWPNLMVLRGEGEHIPKPARAPAFLHQARVMGGGSSINAQIALRGLPRDFDAWEAAGASGWGWAGVLPYFKKLERDLDFHDESHGKSGPVPIRRVPRSGWDRFTRAVTDLWETQGYSFLPDMNSGFDEAGVGDGFAAAPFSNDGSSRWSAARSYLTAEVRRRDNLVILANTEVEKITFEGRKAVGVEARRNGEALSLAGDNVIVTSGALHTPRLLMLSGVGPAAHLSAMGVPVMHDSPGVGQNLQDHPSIYVSCYMPRGFRSGPEYIGPASYLRYSSRIEGCPDSDMVLISAGRSGWHAIGQQLATLVPFVGIPFSRGSVGLSSPSPKGGSKVSFNFLDDWRDRQRLVEAFRACGEILLNSAVSKLIDNPFPTIFSQRVAKIAVPTVTNRTLTNLAAALLDSSKGIRRFMINRVVTEAPDLVGLMTNEQAMIDYVCATVGSLWHPSGTCRMGAGTDPEAVTDPMGRVRGLDNLFVADASLMPFVTTTNTNIPVLMMAERIADGIRTAGAQK